MSKSITDCEWFFLQASIVIFYSLQKIETKFFLDNSALFTSRTGIDLIDLEKSQGADMALRIA